MRIQPKFFLLIPVLSGMVVFSGFKGKTSQVPSPKKQEKKIVVYDGKTGFGQWYVCDKSKTSLFEKDKKVIAYINKGSFECFGIYFDAVDLTRTTHFNFSSGLETNYKDDSVELFISFIDASKNMSNFKKLKVRVTKGPLKSHSLALDELIIKELKVDFTRINSILLYVDSKREDGYWGNVVLKDLSFQ
jgi:hypothetical protein